MAPRFPAINQPWMDTYLAQLQKHNVQFLIYSRNRIPGAYQNKVDELGLRNHVLSFDVLKRANITEFIFHNFWRVFKKLFRNKKVQSNHGESWLLTRIKYSHFDLNIDQFKHVGLIHGHEEIASYQFLYLAKILDIPIIVTFHGLPPEGVGQLSKEKRKHLYSYASAIIVNTEFAKSQVVALGASALKVVVLPQGIPLNEFPFKKREAPGHEKEVKLLSVGRFHRDKGQHFTLIALRRLLNEGFKAKLSLVGVGKDGRQRLEKIITKLSLESNVLFFEDISNKQLLELYHQNHIFILASTTSKSGAHTETQGVVVQESQSTGLIPVVTNVGGIPECVNNGVDSLIVNERSSKSLVDAIVRLLNMPEKWNDMQRKARNNVEQNYSDDIIGTQMYQLISKHMM